MPPRGARKPSRVERRAERTRSLVEGESVDDYRHGDKRKNIPGSGQADYDKEPVQRKKYAYDPHLDPQLVWAGKAERTSFEVDTVSLHIHERISTQAILRAAQSRAVQRTLFNDPAEELKPSQRVEFYKHDMGWTNRLILGDSLVVMNSLLEREGMAGKVQCVYLDPPYGVEYNSNFQPLTNDRDVRPGRDESMNREPETIQAYRDTWQLKIHSYLTYLRDRLFLAKDLLSETGSIFVQISNDNIHHVRELLDEIFGSENACGVISFVKTTGLKTRLLADRTDFLLWYAKDKKNVKFRRLFLTKVEGEEGATQYDWIHKVSGEKRRLREGERPEEGDKLFHIGDMSAMFTSPDLAYEFEFEGRRLRPPQNRQWQTNREGMKRLAEKGRLLLVGNSLRYVRYLDDFPVFPLNTLWTDTGISGFGEPKIYAVQTNTKVVQRCILMTTDPADIVLDPTCGSGTTAFVSEQWGRRWITIDTSRVALSLARERLLTARFPNYKLQNEELGVRGGFEYETAPHVTLKSLAQDEASPSEPLYDRPLEKKVSVRVSGPFSVEAIPKFTILDLNASGNGRAENTQANISNLIELLRKDGVTFKGGKKMAFTRLTPTSGGVVHAEGEAMQDGKPIQVAVSIGPMHGPVTVDQMIEATNELSADVKLLVFVGFSFDPECFAFRDKRQPKSTHWEFAHAAADILVGDLLKNKRNDQLFTVFGSVDVTLHKEKNDKFSVELLGLDIYDPTTGEVQSTGAPEEAERHVAAWFLDTNYDRNTFLVCQAFFPAQGPEAWEKLARALKGTIDDEKWEALSSLHSLPFEPGDQRRVAVKVIDHRGNEIMKVLDLPRA